MKFIHCADFHLGTSFSASSLPAEVVAAHRRSMFDSFMKVIETAGEQKTDVLLIAGDLFDARYARATDMRRIADAFARIPDTKVFISCGNHDPLTDDSYYATYDFGPNVSVFPNELTSVELPEINTVIYGYSWRRNRYDMLPFELKKTDKDKINILCLHCDCTTRSSYMPVDAARFEEAGFDYTALGHIHKPLRIKERVYYSGSCEPLDFTETGKHGFISGEIDGETKEFHARFIPCATKRFETVHFDTSGMDTYNEVEGMLRRVLPDDKDVILRVIFEGTKNTEIDLNQVILDLSSNYYSLTFKDRTSVDFNIERLYDENENNIIGKYITALVKAAKTDEIADIALYSGLAALLKNKE